MNKLALWAVSLIIVAACAGAAFASPDKSVAAYKKAADHYRAVKSHGKKTTRADLEKSLAKFKDIYSKYPRGSKTPDALYMSGRIYSELYKQYRKSVDKENALTIYRVLVRSYPSHSLSDEALYDSGEIHLLENKKLEALSDFRGVLRWFPKSGSAPKAKVMIARLDKEIGKSKSSPKKIVPQRAEEADAPELKQVRYWGNSVYTRVVFELDKKVHYRASSNAEGDGIIVDLLDLDNEELAAKLLKPLEIYVESIQISKLSNDITRALIKLRSKGTYSTIELSHPERIVVDLNVAKPEQPGAEAKAETTEEKPEPKKPIGLKKERGPVASKIPAPNLSLPPIAPLPLVTAAIPKSSTEAVIEPLEKKKPATEKPSAATEEASLQPMPVPKPNKLRTIVIDPGHGGKDPGAVGRGGLKEKDVTLDIALKLRKQLSADCKCKVLMTRTTDVFIPLEERTAYANTVEADLFISIHVNSNPHKNAKGVETYFLSPARSKNESYVAARENMIQQESDNEDMNDLAFILFDMQNTDKINESSRMAGVVQGSLAGKLNSSYKIKNNGVKQAMFYVLHGARMPSILVETSFISNPAEEKLLRSQSYKEEIAMGIAKGVADYAKETQMALALE